MAGSERKEFQASQVINGTWGEVWVDGEYLAQATALKAEVSVKTTSIAMIRKLQEGQKIVGLEQKGEIKLHKINSFILEKLSSKFKKGKMFECTIISQIKDPDGLGNEKVVLTGCKFDKLTLIDWEAGKMGEESYSFTFEDWKIKKSIKQK